MPGHDGRCPSSANAPRAAVMFPPRQEQTPQRILHDSATQGETTSMLSDSTLSGRSAVYCPEDLALLGTILDQVVQSLPPDLRTAHHRAALARNIFACAATGERDPEQLRRAALTDLKVAA